jgi:HK97 family phage portal protein
MARKYIIFGPKKEPKKERAYDSDITNPAELLGIGAKTSAGITVTKETSLKFTAVLAAVSLRSSLIASFPKQVFETIGDNKNKVNDSLSKLLAFRPNPYMNAYTFWELNNVYLDLWGNAYNIITRSRGEAIALTPVHPVYVEVVVVDNKIVYRVSGTNSSLDKDYKLMDMLHFKDMSTDGLVGKSRITLAKESIGLGLAAEDFGATFFGKGGHSDAVLEMDGQMGDEAYKTFVERWSKNVNHGTPLLEHGIKHKNIIIPPENAQFLATREFQVQDVARIFNVPPPLLFDLSRATFSNIEQQDIQFVKYGLRPTVERYESEIEWKLIPDSEIGEKEVRFNLDAMLRGDMDARSKFYASAITNTWLSPNEVRGFENLNPREGGDTYENPNTSSNTNNNGNNNTD